MKGRLNFRVNTKALLEINRSSSACPSVDEPWVEFIVLLPRITAKSNELNEWSERYSAFGFQFNTGIMWNRSSDFWGFSFQVLGVGFKVSIQTGY